MLCMSSATSPGLNLCGYVCVCVCAVESVCVLCMYALLRDTALYLWSYLRRPTSVPCFSRCSSCVVSAMCAFLCTAHTTLVSEVKWCECAYQTLTHTLPHGSRFRAVGPHRRRRYPPEEDRVRRTGAATGRHGARGIRPSAVRAPLPWGLQCCGESAQCTHDIHTHTARRFHVV